MSLTEIYEKKMQVQLDELEAEIDELMEKADQTKTNLQIEYHTLIGELQVKLESANQKFHPLKQACEENCEEFNSRFELVRDSLRDPIKPVTSP